MVAPTVITLTADVAALTARVVALEAQVAALNTSDAASGWKQWRENKGNREQGPS
jgi:hypothetical protein